MEKPRTVRANLLEVGKDFEIRIRSYTGPRKTRTVRYLELLRKRIKITIKDLNKKIKELQEKYPDKGYALLRYKVDGKIYWVIRRKAEGEKTVPVYYSSTKGKLFVPKSYVKKQYRLTCSIISYRLRDLGAPYRLYT